MRLWHVADGALAHVLRAHFALVSGVAFSPDGEWLVTAGPTTAGLWHADTGAFVASLRGHTVRLVGAGFAGGGTEIVTASVDGTVRRYACAVCARPAAHRRLAATGRTLTPDEQSRFLRP